MFNVRRAACHVRRARATCNVRPWSAGADQVQALTRPPAIPPPIRNPHSESVQACACALVNLALAQKAPSRTELAKFLLHALGLAPGNAAAHYNLAVLSRAPSPRAPSPRAPSPRAPSPEPRVPSPEPRVPSPNRLHNDRIRRQHSSCQHPRPRSSRTCRPRRRRARQAGRARWTTLTSELSKCPKSMPC